MEYNGFKIGDLDSLENKIFSTQKTVYDAPERAVEMLTIPGRNGAIALDQGRWENQPVTYRCGCYAESDEKFAEKIAAFRSKLLLKTSYEILTDSYNPDEFRLGLYRSGLEADTVSRNHAGEFDVEFDCKPQRFLVSGNVPKTVGEWGETTKLSGEVVTFEAGETDAFKSLAVEMAPIQDLHGYDHPWVGGAGKNLFHFTAGRSAYVWADGFGFSAINVDDDGVTFNGTASSAHSFSVTGAELSLKAGTYKVSTQSPNVGLSLQKDGQSVVTSYGTGGAAFTLSGNLTLTISITVVSGASFNNQKVGFQIEEGSTATSWTPYSNICPISGWDSVEVVVSPTESAEDGTTHTATFDETVYGGTVDLVSGVLNSKPYYASYNGETLTGEWISDRDEYVVGTTPTIGAQVVNVGADGTDTQLDPQTITTLVGVNNVWSDAGAVTVEYGASPYIFYNETGYPAKPLIVITGNGTVGVGRHLITVEGATSPVYIDCESMEIYTETGGIISGASSLVSFNTNEFPTLEAGANGVSVGSGISSVVITPRWWRL